MFTAELTKLIIFTATYSNGVDKLLRTRLSAMARVTRSSLKSTSPMESAAIVESGKGGKSRRAVKKPQVESPSIPDAKEEDATEAPKPKRRKTATKLEPVAGPSRPLNPLGDAPTPLLPASLIFDVPTAIAHLSNTDPRFGRMFDTLPCKPFQPPLEAIDPFKTLVTSIIGQQVSWMAARAINNRFMAIFGFGDGTGSQEVKGYPTPGMVAAADVMKLKSVGLSLRKAEYGQYKLILRPKQR